MHKDLKISEPSEIHEVNRSHLDQLNSWCYENRSIPSQLIEVGSTKSRSIRLLVVQIIDRSNCLSRIFIFSGSTLNSENNQIAFDVFLSLI